MRIIKSYPLLKLVNSSINSPQPSNLNYLPNFGSLLGLCLGIQIITGITLAMHYNSNVFDAFNIVVYIMKDVNNVSFIRYLQLNITSYLHISKKSCCEFHKDFITLQLKNKIDKLLEWTLTSPPKPHAFVSLPLQSKISFKNIFKFIVIGFITFTVGYALRASILYMRDINVLTQIYHIESVMYYLSMSYIGLGLREFLVKYTSYQDMVNFVKAFFSNGGGKATMGGPQGMDQSSKQTVKKFTVMARSPAGPDIKLEEQEMEAIREAADRAAALEAARVSAVLNAAQAASDRVRQEALLEIGRLASEDGVTRSAAIAAENLVASLPEGPDKLAAEMAAKEAREISDAKQKELVDRVNTMNTDVATAYWEIRQANGV